MARKPRPSEIAKKKAAGTKPPAASKPPKVKAEKAPGPKRGKSGTPPEAQVVKLPPRGTVKTLVERLAKLQAEAQSFTGDMGKAVAVAKADKHVDTVALSITRRLDKMTRNKKTKNALQKFQTTYYHLQEYFREMGFQELADKQGQLELRGTPEVEPEITEAEPEITEAEPEITEAAEVQPEDEPAAGAEGASSPRMRLVGAEENAA